MASRKLVALSVLLVVLVVAGAAVTLVTAAGWVATPPPAWPVSDYAPTPHAAPDSPWGTLDHGNFTVAGSTFVGELTGPQRAGAGNATLTVHVRHTSGSGGRVEITNMTVRGAQDTPIAFGEGICTDPNGTCRTAGAHLDAASNVTVVAIVDAYREAAWGAWRLEPIALRFEARIEVS